MIQRIINNKHYSDSALITRDKFLSEGEIVISNEVGFEGIYILNTHGDVVRIGHRNGESEDSGNTGYIDTELLREYLNEHAYITSAETADILSAISELSNRIDNIPSSVTPTTGGVVDLSEVYEKIDELSGATEEHINQNASEFQAIDGKISILSGLTAEILSEDQIRDIVIEEIAFLVSSADTMFDTLRALADWITNDETGSAQLIADVVTVKESVSGLTERTSEIADAVISNTEDLGNLENRIEDVENDVADIAVDVMSLSGSVVSHIAQNETDLQELNDKIDAIEIPEIPEIPEPVSDEHIRDIAAQEVSSLVSSADSMYQVLQELAEWVENDTTGSAQLIADVGELKDAVSANTRNLSVAFEQIQGTREMLDVHQDDIDTLYERVEAVEDAIENIPSASTPSIDEDTLNALKAYVDEKMAALTRESDHVFLSRSQYREIVYNGQTTIDGKIYYYSDDIYYCIYEDTTPVDSGSTSGSSYEYDEENGIVEFSGDTVVEDGIVEIAASVDEDGYVTITEAEPQTDEGPEVDEDDNLDLSEVTDGEVDEDGYLNLEVPNNWEII